MKAFIVKELFWLVIASLISSGLAFVFLELLSLTSSSYKLNDIEKLFFIQLYLIGWLVSFVSVYIVRIVVSAIKKYLKF